jgi:Ca2+-binding RTX toxin-like protein
MKRIQRKQNIMFTINRSPRCAAQCLTIVCGLLVMSTALPAWAGASVTVVNPTTSPVPTSDVNEPALQPFQATLFPHSPSSNEATDSFTVPAGKRLVIEYYSSQAQDLSGGGAGMVLLITAGGTTVQYIIYVNANTTNQVNQTARIYADPGSTVEAFAFNSAPAMSCAGFVTVSGHLVNLP